jgi:quercetin dioxygenase-like cupin family protein
MADRRGDGVTRTIHRFGDADWHVPVSPGVDREQAEAAGQMGAGRKFLAQGDGGFYAQVVRIPPAFDAPVHSHDHPEIFMVLEGSCRFDGQPMERYDMTVVAAHQPYGFVAGPDGLQFLVVRTAEASFAAATSGEQHDLVTGEERTA